MTSSTVKFSGTVTVAQTITRLPAGSAVPSAPSTDSGVSRATRSPHWRQYSCAARA